MAKLQITNARIRLSPRERVIVTRDLESLAKYTSKQDTGRLAADFKRRSGFRNAFERSLLKANLDLEPLRERHKVESSRLDYDLVKTAKKLARRPVKRGRLKQRNTIWGLSSGVETPPYDFNWTWHNVVGAPLDFATDANANTGHLRAYAHCHDSHPKAVDAQAGVGFWYVPNRTGILNVSIAPHLNQFMWTGAGWNDVAAAGGWISLGIASYLRDPFQFVRWETIRTDQLWWNVDNWFDWTDHDVDTAAYGMSVNTIADGLHYYACWAWVRAYTYAENGGSYAGSAVTADVGGFTFSFL
jgi:hypothetical protein